MGPKIVKCASCGQDVDLTHFVSALNKNNVFLVVDAVIDILRKKPVNPNIAGYRQYQIYNHSYDPFSGECHLCRQYVPRNLRKRP